jgi:hypothetical protein
MAVKELERLKVPGTPAAEPMAKRKEFVSPAKQPIVYLTEAIVLVGW